MSGVLACCEEKEDVEVFLSFLSVGFAFCACLLHADERRLQGVLTVQHGSQVPVQPAQSARSACQDVHV
ncbi:hypothetical protein ILYODFUR_036249 [Ilyodon furcidens]|uniref:Uncharacterized protein n=1 Tax=Ilyodon furcidens TaxID=33524 RepID=A0ABV0T339_9TELE